MLSQEELSQVVTLRFCKSLFPNYDDRSRPSQDAKQRPVCKVAALPLVVFADAQKLTFIKRCLSAITEVANMASVVNLRGRIHQVVHNGHGNLKELSVA